LLQPLLFQSQELFLLTIKSLNTVVNICTT